MGVTDLYLLSPANQCSTTSMAYLKVAVLVVAMAAVAMCQEQQEGEALTQAGAEQGKEKFWGLHGYAHPGYLAGYHGYGWAAHPYAYGYAAGYHPGYYGYAHGYGYGYPLWRSGKEPAPEQQ